jgi:hypothetical protein
MIRSGPLTHGLNSARSEMAQASFGPPEVGSARDRDGPFRPIKARARPEPCQIWLEPDRAGPGATLLFETRNAQERP